MSGCWSTKPRLRAKLPNLSEAQIRERLGIRNPRLEGLFLPDTYAYVAGMSDLDVLALAYTRLLDVLHEEWEERVNGLPYASPYEALIVASLVEKETGRAQDRAAIAEVFAERLRLGMKLQTDPSVIYAMGPNFNGNLTRADLATDDPYNTYMYAGLPPSPIALAGRAALHATLHPLATGDLYFVARGDGSSEFSQTLAQHDRAVDRFQRGRTGSQNNSPLVPALPEAALPAASAPGASPSPPMPPITSVSPACSSSSMA